MLKWLGRNEYVGYMAKLEEKWPIGVMGGGVPRTALPRVSGGECAGGQM
jgi:hypothetical protein